MKKSFSFSFKFDIKLWIFFHQKIFTPRKRGFTLLNIFNYEGQSKNNEPKSLLAIFVAIKSKVIHQKKAQG